MLRNNLLCSAAAVAAIALAGAAHASEIWGGGSTLAQPYYETVFGILNSQSPAATFGTGTGDAQAGYAGLGSGAGRTQFETNYANTAKGEIPAGSNVSYGASDAYLTTGGASNTSEVANWNNGYTTKSTDVPASTVIPAMLPVDGPLIQMPLLGTPVTIAYDITNTGTGTLPSPIKLTDSDLCGIYSGKITNWSQTTYFAAQKAGKFAFTNLTVAWRSDSSGTTFLFTQHLAKVCTASNSNFNFGTGGLTGAVSVWTPSLFAGNALPSTFITATDGGETGVGSNGLTGGASGSSHVANYLTTGSVLGGTGAAPANSIGYISPDYTSIAPNSGHATSLPVASLLNAADNLYFTPTIANVGAALGNPGKGVKYAGAPSTKTEAQTQADWVPQIPTPAKGYPIVGYTNMLFAQCYADNNVATELLAFLTAHVNGTYQTQETNAGFNPLPTGFVTAIQKDFITNTSKYNLNIQNPAECKSATGASSKAPYVGR